MISKVILYKKTLPIISIGRVIYRFMIDLKSICPRCLLEKASAGFDLAEYKDRIDEDARTTDDEYARRLGICSECDRLNAGLCSACGCYVELRALTAARHCPYDRW